MSAKRYSRATKRAMAHAWIVRGLTYRQIRARWGASNWTIGRAIASVDPWTLEDKANPRLEVEVTASIQEAAA